MHFRIWLGAAALSLSLACGGGTGSAIDPDLDEFVVDPAAQEEIDNAVETGNSAEGSYTFDDEADQLTITISASSFACGIDTGDTIEATVVELTATTMVWRFADDASVTWSRVDMGGTGIVGIWQTNDPELFLILSSDGSAQLIGPGEICDDERARNDDGCYEVGITSASIAIDGDLSDWNAIGSPGTLTDPRGDAMSSEAGADLLGIKVDFSVDVIHVLMQLGGAPSETFQARQPPNGGVYRLTVRGQNGLSLVERVAYSPEQQSWSTLGDAAQITAGVGADGIEWSVDVSAYTGEGFRAVDFIFAETIGSTSTIDQMDCAFFQVP